MMLEPVKRERKGHKEDEFLFSVCWYLKTVYLFGPVFILSTVTTIDILLLLLKIEFQKIVRFFSPSLFPTTYVIPSISFYMLEGGGEFRCVYIRIESFSPGLELVLARGVCPRWVALGWLAMCEFGTARRAAKAA